MAQQNPLEKYFLKNRGRQIDKWMHYFDIYHRHFQKYRFTRPTVLEIGVQHGGSLQMWRSYFGGRARIIGVDIDPRCLEVADGGTVIIGDQSDRDFLRALAHEIGPIDVVIDDGGHRMDQQINTFEELWPSVTDGGTFLVEDTHTSYWDEYGGGYRREGAFIEYTKGIIDQLNALHSRDDELVPNELTSTLGGLHFYDSVVVFDKTHRPPLERRATGTPSFEL
jgi:hypothetical protein